MKTFRRDPDRDELARLLRGRPNFRVHTSKSQVAAALWDYGEDDLAERAMAMSDDELARIENISAWFEDPSYPLPMTGQRITHNHVNAFAAITLFEGRLRPLNRTRRRPERGRPDRFNPLPPPVDA
ncbi:MAG: hypothetical protein KDB63_18770 [Nocardioidaceae bacterium]|nr:hypothetical protein [Nocardioidaceae bacterium]